MLVHACSFRTGNPVVFYPHCWCYRTLFLLCLTADNYQTTAPPTKPAVTTTQGEVGLMNFEVFGNRMKHYLECLIDIDNRN